MQDREHDLDGGPPLLLHDPDRDAGAVVDDGMQAAGAGGPDVHAGALAHRLEALEDGDVPGVVGGRSLPAVRGCRVLRQRASVDVKNPGSGLAATRPGLEQLVDRRIAHEGWSPAGQTVPKALQTATKVRRHPHPLAGADEQRSDRTVCAPRAALIRPTSSGPMRSSSWAQTADEQVTVSTPSRSPVGSAWAAITAPTTSGQTRCTSASVVWGARRSARAAMAWDSGRGWVRLTPSPPPRPLRPPRAGAQHRRRPPRARGPGPSSSPPTAPPA